jgi:hypothetical protein
LARDQLRRLAVEVVVVGRWGKMPVGRQTLDDVSKSSSEPDPSWLC